MALYIITDRVVGSEPEEGATPDRAVPARVPTDWLGVKNRTPSLRAFQRTYERHNQLNPNAGIVNSGASVNGGCDDTSLGCDD